jgi:hypothetical protein
MKKKTKMLNTPDEWHPCYPQNKVEVSTMPLTDGKFRVCVWGTDDFGMERDYETAKEALAVYASIQSPVTIKGLKTLGFVPS